MTDSVIENHLLGKETVGVYPLLPDETCWFLAADLDQRTWEYDSLAFLETCQELNVPAALERSRSGKGGHIWIFFDRALPSDYRAQTGMRDSHANQCPTYDKPRVIACGHAPARHWSSRRAKVSARHPRNAGCRATRTDTWRSRFRIPSVCRGSTPIVAVVLILPLKVLPRGGRVDQRTPSIPRTSEECQSMRWRASGPVSALHVTWPSWA
jgi:hypothetical protein